ncbi:MAG: 50S ribosomal protein L5 [Candidatus Hodgkinia cicadicola]
MLSVYSKLAQAKLEFVRVLNLRNVCEVPKIKQIVVSSGLNSLRPDASAVAKIVIKDVSMITGLKPMIAMARTSVAGFKIRKGQAVGLKVNLRGQHMYQFLDRLVNVALPRIREFKGLKLSSFDDHNNLSFGIMDYSVFPEIAYSSLNKTLGLNITICIKACHRLHAIMMLEVAGFPLC